MKINLYEMFFRRSFGRDLLCGLIPIIIIVASIIGSINYYYIADKEEKYLIEQAEETTNNLTRILAYSIYNSMHSVTALIGREYQKVLNVTQINIYDKRNNTNYIYENNSNDNNIVIKKPVTIFGKELGNVEICFSKESIIREQKKFFYYTFLITVITIIAVSVASILLLDLLLQKPVEELLNGVDSIAYGSYTKRLPETNHSTIDLIAQNFNRMADSISEREKNLKILIKKLEKEVAERTAVESELRASKEKFEKMTNLLPETVYEVDKRGNILFLNKSGFERFEYSNKDIKNGIKFIDLFSSKDRKIVEEKFLMVLMGKKIGYSEWLAKTKKGKTFQVLVHFNSIHGGGAVVGARGIAVDISESKRIEHELLRYQDKLRLLNTELLIAEERERKRIASEIHDRIGHALANVAMKICLLRDLSDDHERKILIKEMQHLIEASSNDVQSLIFEISPPILYDLGLIPAIDWLVEIFSKKYSLKLEFCYEEDIKQIDDNLKSFLFRSIRELIFNVIKHAEADKAKVIIREKPDRLTITVEDNGKGIDEKGYDMKTVVKGFGLFSIRERLSQFNGNLHIDSSSKKGTTIVLEVPFE